MKEPDMFDSHSVPSLTQHTKRVVADTVFPLLHYPVRFEGQHEDGEWHLFFEAQNQNDIEYRLQSYGLGEEYVAMRAVSADGRIFHHTMDEIIQVEKDTGIKAKRQLAPLRAFAQSTPLEAVDTASEIMKASEASQHFTIPHRATVILDHPALHRIVFIEFEDSVACRLYATHYPYQSDVTVTIWKKQHPQIEQGRIKEGLPEDFPPFTMSPRGLAPQIQSFLFLLCASIVRDFWVLNEMSRRSTYQSRTEKKRQRIGKGKNRKLEIQKNYTFIPRFKYNLDAYNTKTKTAVQHGVRVTLSPALVSGHIRKLPEGWKTSKEAIENANEFGISHIATGTTFVRPHKRGEIDQLRSYRSHSALQLLFEQKGNSDEAESD